MSVFLDTNILVYAQQDEPRGARAREIVARGGTINVQVLNEFANVLKRKMGQDWPAIIAAIEDVGVLLGAALPITGAINARALTLARDHRFAFYDALIVAAAIDAKCRTLYSEDMQHGRTIEGLTIVDPFL